MMSYDKNKVKQPFGAPPIPDDFCAWVGKIAITWGLVELHIDSLIAALESETGEPPTAKRQNFKKRRERCKNLSKRAFASNQTVTTTINKILSDAAEVQWKRNLIMHGQLKSKLYVRDGGKINFRIEGELIIKGYHNSKEVTLYYSVNDVEHLFYTIAHICGRLEQLVTLDAVIPEISSRDKLRLRSFLLANFPTSPTSPTP